MKRQNLLKSTLCLLLGLMCHMAWAQTYPVSLQQEKPANGYYLIYSESSSGKGWVYYDASLDRKFRVDTDVDYSTEVPTEAAHLWRLRNGANNTFTLQNKASEVYMPADVERNKNMAGSETGNFAIEEVPGMEAAWYIAQTNYTNGGNTLYIHTNSPGGDPNLSYWDDKSVDGTSIRIKFYKVGVPEDTPEALEAAKEAAKNDVAANESKLKEALGYYAYIIDGVKTYTIADVNAAIDAAESIDDVNDITGSFTPNVPEVGKHYRIKGISGNYIDAVNCYSGDQMGMRSAETCDFYGTIFLLDEGNRLKNVGTDTYVHGTRHIGATKANANTWTFAASARTLGCLTLTANGTASHQLHDSDGNRADRCGSICGNRHDFTLEEVKAVSLTVNAPAKVGASGTWNGETKTLPATWSIFGGATVTESALSISNYGGYTFDGLYENEESLGNALTIASLDANRTLTAHFTPNFFSATYGDKWVRLLNCSNANYAATVESTEASGSGKTSTLDYADEKQLWCLVGNAESFVLYNKAAGDKLALKVTAATCENGSPATMEDDTKASWKLIEQDFGYALVPTHNSNASDMGINMYGGNGGLLKLYYTGAGNAGSYWTVELADVANPLTLNVAVDRVWESSPRVAELTFTVNGKDSQTRILSSVAGQKLYLPAGATYSVSSMTYRGYTYNGYEEADGTLTVSYTANDERTLYYSPDANGKPYRIPAIAAAANGHLFAIADNRPSGADIGYGEVDIKCRISTDNGVTWSEEFFLANGDGTITTNNMKYGYGDAAVVGDRESNKLLAMMVAGHTVCHNGRWDTSKIGNPDAEAVNRVARVYATFNEATQEWEWTEPEEVTDAMYSIFLDGTTPTVTSMFIGSGKICQSRVVKKGEYYRLYCSIWTRDGGNRVIYSDDFGGTWNVLGTIADRPAPYGDEPKCEELPDGTVVLSSRKSGGRYFNLFTFNDDTFTTGTWGTAAACSETYDGSNQGTNGEIYKLQAIRKSDGQVCDVMLQSVPAGPGGRYNVTVYYKEMDYTTPYTPSTFATGWAVGKQVSEKYSAYSTMILQADGRIGFLFEEAPNECIIYIPYTLEDLTAGNYSLYVPEGEGTTIEHSTLDAQHSAEVYDLYGRRVSTMSKGSIYVINGKKAMRK